MSHCLAHTGNRDWRWLLCNLGVTSLWSSVKAWTSQWVFSTTRGQLKKRLELKYCYLRSLWSLLSNQTEWYGTWSGVLLKLAGESPRTVCLSKQREICPTGCLSVRGALQVRLWFQTTHIRSFTLFLLLLTLMELVLSHRNITDTNEIREKFTDLPFF